MIAIATHAANGLNQQGEFVVIKRLLQAAHHRDFILQVALQMDGPTLLKIFRMVGGERQVGNHAQLAQHQIKMVNRGPDIAIAHAHLRLKRHAVPDKAELLDMLVQGFNPLLVRFRVEPYRQVIPGQVIHQLIGLENAIHPLRQLLLVLNPQQHAVISAQNFQLRNAQQAERRPRVFRQIARQRPQVRHMDDRVEQRQPAGAFVRRALPGRQHRHINHHEGEDQVTGRGDRQLNVIPRIHRDIAVKIVNRHQQYRRPNKRNQLIAKTHRAPEHHRHQQGKSVVGGENGAVLIHRNQQQRKQPAKRDSPHQQLNDRHLFVYLGTDLREKAFDIARMSKQADQQIAQRHARQPADQQRLIVDERANIEGI